jgi:hypothetical protein
MICHYVLADLNLAERRWNNDAKFRLFKKQLYHDTLASILEPLRKGMSSPVVLRCGDGHFRRVLFSLGPFIADYPEQVFAAGIVQGWCPKYVFPLLPPVLKADGLVADVTFTQMILIMSASLVHERLTSGFILHTEKITLHYGPSMV